MFLLRAVLLMALFVCGCGGPPDVGGVGGGTGGVGGSGGSGGGSAGQFSCTDIRKEYELTGTNSVAGLCEPGLRIKYAVVATGCSVQFKGSSSTLTVMGSCVVNTFGECDTTVQIMGFAGQIKLKLDSGGATGTASIDTGSNVCTFTVAVPPPPPPLGMPCGCALSGSGVVVCNNSADCNMGEVCTQEDEQHGGHCAPPMAQCSGLFEKVTINGISLCAFKKKHGSCLHSSQCDGCSSNTPGVSYSAGCFSGTCQMRCSGTGGTCGCKSATPTGGNGTGYCTLESCN